MTAGKVSQSGAEFLFVVTPGGDVSQAGAEYLHRVLPGVEVAQAGAEFLHRVQPEFAVSQAGAEILFKSSPCATQRAQVWTIARADGVVKRFTSKDTDLVFKGETYQACSSLDPSAAENVAEIDDVGTMDLAGAIGPGGIDERDLYAGLYDGAQVEAWLVSWGQWETPRRLLAGTFGAVEQTDTGFKVELVGDGARLQQTPLVSLLKPGCRWTFGDPVTCQKGLAPLTVTGTVDSATGLRQFTDAARTEAAGYFRRGRVTFTSGENVGISAEIKEHGAGGVITLWPRLPFAIVPGVSYEMTPGCTNIKDSDGGCNGCTAWANLPRYGGFDKVPGGDQRGKAAVQRAPD